MFGGRVRFQSLSNQHISRAVYENQQLDTLVNTIRKSAMAVRSRRNRGGSANWPESEEGTRSCWNMRSLWCFSLYDITSQQMMISAEGKVGPMPQHQQQKPASAKSNEDQQKEAR